MSAPSAPTHAPVLAALRNVSAYTLCTLIRQFAAFLMLPIYTRWLTPGDYGTVEMLVLIAMLASELLGLDLGAGVLRLYLRSTDPVRRDQIIASALALTTALNAFGCLLLVGLAPLLTQHFLGAASVSLLAWYSGSLLLDAWCAIPLTRLRADDRAGWYVAATLGRLALQIGFNVVALVVYQLGPAGIVAGNLLSSAIAAAVLLPLTIGSRWLHADRTIMRDLARFGAPLALAHLAVFYVNASDRFFLSPLVGIAQLGVYALACRLAQGFSSLAFQPFMQMWEVERYRLVDHEPARPAYDYVFHGLMALQIAGALSLALLAPALLAMLAAPTFAPAAAILPVLLLAQLCQSAAEYCRFGAVLHGRSSLVARGALLTAVIVTLGYLLLIPIFGSIGAAWVTVMAGIIRLAYEYRVARRLFDMRIAWLPVLATLGAAALTYLAALELTGSDGRGLALRVLLCAAFTGACAASLWLRLRGQRSLLSDIAQARQQHATGTSAS